MQCLLYNKIAVPWSCPYRTNRRTKGRRSNLEGSWRWDFCVPLRPKCPKL